MFLEKNGAQTGTPYEINDLSKGTKKLIDATNAFKKNVAKAIKNHDQDDCPIEVLPEKIQNLILELSCKNKFPPCFSTAYLFFTCSVAIGNNYRAELKENWTEPALLYLAVVALAGQMKTPVQAFFTKPLKRKDRRSFTKYNLKLQEYELAKQSATKDNPYQEKKPFWEQILIQDATIEARINVLFNCKRGTGALYDELAGLFGNMNRYSGGNEVPFWLQAYNTQDYSINRKTSSDVYLASPYMPLIGGIQPGILVKVFSGDLLSNGMIDRFLFAYPEIARKEVPSDEEVSNELIETYNSIIDFLLDSDVEVQNYISRSHIGNNYAEKDEKDNFIPLPFDPAARIILNEYLQSNADAVNHENNIGNHRLASMFNKYDYHIIRISLILQLLTDASQRIRSKSITEDSVSGAVKMCEYFKHHSKRVFGLITGSPESAYNEKQQAFYRALPDMEFRLEEAIDLAKEIRSDELELKEDTIIKWVSRFLKNDLFIKPNHGIYKKKLK